MTNNYPVDAPINPGVNFVLTLLPRRRSQMLADSLGIRADGFHCFFEFFGRGTELLRPILDFPFFAHVYARAILRSLFGQIVCHGIHLSEARHEPHKKYDFSVVALFSPAERLLSERPKR
jgi:hypothetical protein